MQTESGLRTEVLVLLVAMKARESYMLPWSHVASFNCHRRGHNESPWVVSWGFMEPWIELKHQEARIVCWNGSNDDWHSKLRYFTSVFILWVWSRKGCSHVHVQGLFWTSRFVIAWTWKMQMHVKLLHKPSIALSTPSQPNAVFFQMRSFSGAETACRVSLCQSSFMSEARWYSIMLSSLRSMLLPSKENKPHRLWLLAKMWSS